MGNAPKLRFEGFTDAWEQRKLGEFVTFFSGLTYSPKDIRPSGTLVLRSSNVKDGEVVDADNVYVDPGVVNSENVQDGDIIVVVRNGSRALIGKHAEIKGFKPNTVIGAFMTGIRSEHSSFVNALLNTPRFDSEVAMNMGATINQITGYMFSKMEFLIPDPKEQDAIGDSFRQLDRLITLHQRKCDLLTKAKTFYLQNLFPQEGEKEPKLRLEGFTDSWNQYSLGDLYTERNERGNETLQILTVSIHTGVSDGALEEDELGKSVRRSEDKTLYKHVYAGDLIFNMMRAWQGAIGVAKSEGMISPAYISAIPNEKVYPPFMNYLLRRKEIISQINNLSYGVTDFRKRLYWDSFIKVKCSLPSVEEQKCITDVFEQLDTLITRQEHKIKALKTMKKFMLQNMFPQEG